MKEYSDPEGRTVPVSMVCPPDQEYVQSTYRHLRSGRIVFVDGFCRKIPKDRHRVFGFRSEREMMDHVKKLKEKVR